MKPAVVLLASSLAAVSSMAFASPYVSVPRSHEVPSPASSAPAVATGKKGEARSGYEHFVPRFDGLRFIETLVTAHR